MHMRALSLRLLSLACLFTLAVAVYQRRAPAPAPQASRELHLMKRRDLVVRNKYPDLFKGAKRDTSDPSTGTCKRELMAPAKRDAVPEMLLNGREMAGLLMGRGEFTAPNGTVFVDRAYKRELRNYKDAQFNLMKRVMRTVIDAAGQILLEATIPRYRTWKQRMEPGDIFYVTKTTGIRSEDIGELEDALLSDPDFEELQFWGVRVTRRYLQAAVEYGY